MKVNAAAIRKALPVVGFSVRFRFCHQLFVNPAARPVLAKKVDSLSAGDRK